MNSDSWWFNVKPGGIVAFPSNLTHRVENVEADETRISIAFNTFVKGILGDNKSLTEFINE
jgi:quercetin dioxygenase-like cupin family protein